MKKLLEKLKYRFDRFLAKGTISLVLSLFFLMFVIVVLVGIIIFIFDPTFELGNLVWISFMQTLDPGNLSGETGSILYMVMMTIATIVGIFITSLFISFILNGFQTRLEKLSRGRSKVIERNHTLILGWNDNIFVILEELIEANKSIRKPVIVILSDMDSVVMNQLIKDNIEKIFNTRIICRTGSIFKKTDLEMCSISDARSVIINENDLNTIKSLLVVVNTDFYTESNGHICGLMYDDLNISVAKNIGKEKLELVYLKSSITRIIAQTCLQPGLSYVYNELLEFKGDEIYFYENQELEGKVFSDLINMFSQAVPIGFMSEKGPTVNPNKDYVLQKGDSLILIAEDEDTAVLESTQIKVDFRPILDTKRHSSQKKANVFVIGFNKKTVEVIKEFDHYLLEGSQIEVLVNSEASKEKILELGPCLQNITLEVFVGDTYKRAALNEHIKKTCNSIIIFSNQNVEKEEQDSQTLLTLLHLRDMEEELDTNFDIITEIYDVKNSEIVDLAKVDDFIISELIANKMLAQVSENRYLKEIFDHLLSDAGSEIYLKPITNYVDVTHPLDFYTLSKAAIGKNEIAIGYKHTVENQLPIVELNPLKSKKVKFNEKDCIIVISED